MDRCNKFAVSNLLLFTIRLISQVEIGKKVLCQITDWSLSGTCLLLGLTSLAVSWLITNVPHRHGTSEAELLVLSQG